MSTYDAYQLSVRDSTEFTVPTGGNSGGESDFSTAKLTVNITGETDYAYLDPMLIPYISEEGICSSILPPLNETTVYDIPLYKGKLIIRDHIATEDIMTGSCSVYVDDLFGPTIEITGDVTITYTIVR